MTHAIDCPTRYGCCPNDEYGCAIHIEPPCNCDATDDPDVVVTLSVCLDCPDHISSPAVTEPGSVPEPSNTDSGCSSKDDRGLPSACFRCGAAIWNGNVHRNGHTECDMWQVPGV